MPTASRSRFWRARDSGGYAAVADAMRGTACAIEADSYRRVGTGGLVPVRNSTGSIMLGVRLIVGARVGAGAFDEGALAATGAADDDDAEVGALLRYIVLCERALVNVQGMRDAPACSLAVKDVSEIGPLGPRLPPPLLSGGGAAAAATAGRSTRRSVTGMMRSVAALASASLFGW